MDERLDALEADFKELTAKIEDHARRIEALRAFFEESLPKLDHGSEGFQGDMSVPEA
jgi:hypothetical protein